MKYAIVRTDNKNNIEPSLTFGTKAETDKRADEMYKSNFIMLQACGIGYLVKQV